MLESNDIIPPDALLKSTTIAAIEQSWKELPRDWINFRQLLQPDDEVWEYESVQAHMGWCCGEGGYAIVRGLVVIAKYPTWACG